MITQDLISRCRLGARMLWQDVCRVRLGKHSVQERKVAFACVLASVFCFLNATLSVAIGQTRVESASAKRPQAKWSSFGLNRNWECNFALSGVQSLEPVWTIDAGASRSQVVGNENAIVVTSGGWGEAEDANEKRKVVLHSVAAYRNSDGKELWRYSESGRLGENQQTFGGAEPSPRSTPLLLGKNLVAVSFTGNVVCLNANSGSKLWKLNLVDRFKIAPVQFGFSSSPVRVPNSQSDFVLAAGGGDGGLFCISAKDGAIRWVCPIDGFSYATPVYATLAGTPQWLLLGQDAVLGVSTAGKLLWSSALRESGLTNVPSALIVDDSHVLVAGQGCEGTQCLEVTKAEEGWQATEKWHNRKLGFFYTNWQMLDAKHAVGCTEGYLVVFDSMTGEIKGRWREFRDGNLVKANDGFMLLDGRGILSLIDHNMNSAEMRPSYSYRVASGRTWVAPTVIGDSVFVRTDKQVSRFRLQTSSVQNALPNLRTKESAEVLAYGAIKEIRPDPAARILDVFQKEGQEAALALYGRYRGEKTLAVEHRLALAEAAYGAGLMPIANMVIKDALKDFPNSAKLKAAVREWQGN